MYCREAHLLSFQRILSVYFVSNKPQLKEMYILIEKMDYVRNQPKVQFLFFVSDLFKKYTLILEYSFLISAFDIWLL